MDGKADVAATVNGAPRPMTLTAAKQTNVPNSGRDADRGLRPGRVVRRAAAGTAYAVAVGDFTATLNLYEANGTPCPRPCRRRSSRAYSTPGRTPAVDTITVVKDATTRERRGPRHRAHHRPKAKVTVSPSTEASPRARSRPSCSARARSLQTKVLGLRDGARKVRFAAGVEDGRLHRPGALPGRRELDRRPGDRHLHRRVARRAELRSESRVVPREQVRQRRGGLLSMTLSRSMDSSRTGSPAPRAPSPSQRARSAWWPRPTAPRPR